MLKTKTTPSLKNKSILLGITGSIAVQKMPILVQSLVDKGTTVRIILTKGAKKLLTESDFDVLNQLTKGEIYQDLFEKDDKMSHIDLTRKSDLFVIAPITADTISKLANANANNLLSATALASNIKIMIAPAMNKQMYQNQLMQENLKKLQSFNQYIFIPPDYGQLACNEVGFGRLVDIEVLTNCIENYFNAQTLLGKKVLITVGATIEYIDPVRFISNFSSGKMGYCLMEAFSSLGAETTLIEGKIDLSDYSKINNPTKTIKVKSADQMYDSTINEINLLAKNGSRFDYFVGCAAVSDYKPKNIANQKIKKNQDSLTIELIKNKDIVSSVSNLNANRPKVVVGFAAETENVLQNAIKKLNEKKLDFICANEVGEKKAFGTDKNDLTLIDKNGKIQAHFENQDKRLIAKKLVDFLSKFKT